MSLRNFSLTELYALWDQLKVIPLSDNPSTSITTPFLTFPVGTPRTDIWHWMEQQNPLFSANEVDQGNRYSRQFERESIQRHMLQLLAAKVAKAGDIFTDAPESKAAVFAMENLSLLGCKLTKTNTDASLCTGLLLAPGYEPIPATCAIDGTISSSALTADQQNPMSASWVFKPSGPGTSFAVTIYQCADDGSFTWLIKHPGDFYQYMLRV